VESFTGKLAVVTDGGSGMGRELVRQLAAQGCGLAAAELAALRAEHPGLSWHTAGNHMPDSGPFWRAVAVESLAATSGASSAPTARHELEASSPGSPASRHPRSGIGAAEPEIPELGYVSLLAGRSRCRLVGLLGLGMDLPSTCGVPGGSGAECGSGLRAAGWGTRGVGSVAGLGQHLAQVDNCLGVDVLVAGRVEVLGPGRDGHGDLAAVLLLG
jgi:hypothetical protein